MNGFLWAAVAVAALGIAGGVIVMNMPTNKSADDYGNLIAGPMLAALGIVVAVILAGAGLLIKLF